MARAQICGNMPAGKGGPMNSPAMRLTAISLACSALLLSACGGMKPKIWPFGGDTAQERPRTPANAVEYLCGAGKRFYLRRLDEATVWLILPERELRLDRIGTGQRYSKGNTVLELGDDAVLSDGGTTNFTGCKPAAAGS